MIIVPPPGDHPWQWLLGIIIGVVLVILMLPFLDRFLGPIVDKWTDWVERKLGNGTHH